MTGFIKYINHTDGYGYISVPDRSKRDIPFQIPPGMRLEKDDTVTFHLACSASGKAYADNVVKQERNRSAYSTEDKQAWVKAGLQEEYDFVAEIVPRIHRTIVMNEEKKVNPYAIDLYDCDNGRYADLKTQETPFFLAAVKYPEYGYDPQYTVTFNHKDYVRYCELYPDCDIYFHVIWKQTSGYGVQVEPMEGVWVAHFQQMRNLIETKKVALHSYMFRQGDKVNAKDSYLFNLNHETFTRLL